MSIEIVADSTISNSVQLPNQLKHETSTLPPLISNSPPPINEDYESGNINDLNTVFSFNNKSLLESNSSSNLANMSLPKINETFCETNILDKKKTTVEAKETISIDDEWTSLNKPIDKIQFYDFETININNEINFNKYHEALIEDTSNWAYFNEVLPQLNT